MIVVTVVVVVVDHAQYRSITLVALLDPSPVIHGRVHL